MVSGVRRSGEPGFDERDGLVPAVPAGRLQAQGLEPARHVERGEIVAAAARIAAFEPVVGEEGDVAAEAFRREFGRRIGRREFGPEAAGVPERG